VTVSRLRELYDIIIFTYGAAKDRQLGIPGEVSSPPSCGNAMAHPSLMLYRLTLL
jgi:NADPH-dependent glutamate synthase beta subunit-like oxidoreductase